MNLIKKKLIENVETVTKSNPFGQTLEGATSPIKEGICECGEPVAEGQTYVCKKHIRRG